MSNNKRLKKGVKTGQITDSVALVPPDKDMKVADELLEQGLCLMTQY